MNNGKRIKIGLDFHGVITTHPEFFSVFTHEAIRREDEIHILTGGPGDVVRCLLDDWNIAYTTIFAILDFYEHLGEVKHFPNGEFKVADALWNTAKAKYCVDNGIDFHIDDSKAYAKWFITPYCLYKGTKQECYVEGRQKIDFSGPAINALDEVEDLVRSQRRLSKA